MSGLSPDQAKESGRSPGFLARLRRDQRGSTLSIVVAGLIPLIAMIGSGIEMSRIYMAKTRLQNACDAASLAARRVMTNDTLNATVTNEAIRFFRFNFPDRLYDTATFTPTVTKPSSGTIRVQAATTIPSALMYIFGHNDFEIEVDCSASQNFVNTDVVLVLDTTGSMLFDVNGNSTSTVADQRITALREAVLALYDELRPIQTELEANGMRLRYGIVPYSSGVNVGQILYAASPSYIADSWTYQSRVPIFRVNEQRTATNWTQGRCNDENNWSWVKTGRSYGNDVGTCTYTVRVDSYTGANNQFDRWQYKPVTHNTATFKTGVSVPNPAGRPGDGLTSTWDGCIEERETVSTITSTSTYDIPAGARDLDINLVPNSDATRWKPYWSDVIYQPNNGGKPQIACPTAAKRLQAWTRANLETYINSINPTGGTYHDNGMIWGARLISDQGVFGADNPNTHNGMPVAKHIIFMTDGVIDTGNTIYSTYGMEYWDKRVTGGWTSDNDQTGRHEQRFKMACNAAKGLNVSIWVIGFGADVATLSQALKDCASDSAQVAAIGNKAALIAKFTEIGKEIGALRLTN